MSLLTQLAEGKVPEVPLKLQVDNESIIKLAVTAVIVATLCLLISHLIKMH